MLIFNKILKAILILLFISHCSLAQKKGKLSNPYQKLKPDSVIMYDFEGNTILSAEGEISEYKSKFRLNKSIAKKFSRTIGKSSSYGQLTGDCWDPHLGIVYFANGKPSAFINVCFYCNILQPSLKIEAIKDEDYGTRKFESGMSKSFRMYLKNILANKNFTHLVNESSVESIVDQTTSK